MNTESNNVIEPFYLFDSSIKEYLEVARPKGNLIYIESEYFGGEGVQFSGVLKDGQLLVAYKGRNEKIVVSAPYPDRLFEQPINKVLRKLGVVRDSKLDKFDTLHLANYRHMPYNEI